MFPTWREKGDTPKGYETTWACFQNVQKGLEWYTSRDRGYWQDNGMSIR